MPVFRAKPADYLIRDYTMKIAEKIYYEAQRLPEHLAQEVLDFIGYIELKHGLKNELDDDSKRAQQPAMRHLWDNADDEVWNDL